MLIIVNHSLENTFLGTPNTFGTSSCTYSEPSKCLNLSTHDWTAVKHRQWRDVPARAHLFQKVVNRLLRSAIMNVTTRSVGGLYLFDVPSVLQHDGFKPALLYILFQPSLELPMSSERWWLPIQMSFSVARALSFSSQPAKFLVPREGTFGAVSQPRCLRLLIVSMSESAERGRGNRNAPVQVGVTGPSDQDIQEDTTSTKTKISRLSLQELELLVCCAMEHKPWDVEYNEKVIAWQSIREELQDAGHFGGCYVGTMRDTMSDLIEFLAV